MAFKYHQDGSQPESGQFFVFGSNLRGAHGAGAAKAAMKYGAKYGCGTGLQGNTYAIPTKDFDILTMELDHIKKYVDEFIQYTWLYPEKEFFLTAIGCGLAGYTPDDIAPMFSGVGENVSLPDCFQNVLEKNDA